MRKPTEITKLKSAQIDSSLASLLENITDGKEILKLKSGIEVFSQGAEADTIYFIRSGKVKVTIAWGEVEELAIAILGPSDFFGEGCLIGQSLRISTVTTAESSTIIKIQKEAMLQALLAQPELSERFIACLIVRNIDIEQDICNQLFNSAEKRLAHVLLKLDRYGRADFLPDTRLSRVSHETLADLVGTTKAQVLGFLDKFRKLGLIQYDGNGGIIVRSRMLADTVLAVGGAHTR